MEEVVGAAPVEALFGIRCETVAAATGRGGHQIGAALENGVQLLAIPGGDVLDVIQSLEAPLNLEGADARGDQRLQVRALIHVFQGEQVAVLHQHLPPWGLQGAGQPAELGALAAVRAAAGAGVADVALAAVGDAERPVDKELQLHLGLGTDGTDLLEREFARQHYLGEAHVLQELHLFRRTVVGLGAGVQRYGRQIQGQQPHVLHYERIGPGLVDLVGQAPGLLQLVVVQQGVEGDEHLGAEAVGVARQHFDIVEGVACRTAGTEGGAAHVDGIGAMVDGFDAIGEVLGRSQQLEAVSLGVILHGSGLKADEKCPSL